jgi:hypothetical protein
MHDVIHHSEIGTQHAMTEVMIHIQVLLNLTGTSEHFCPQYNECVTAMMTIPPGEIMCLLQIADLSDKAPCNVHDYNQWGDTIPLILTEITFGTPYIQKA